MKTFRNNDGRGFQITLPNGVTLSTQFSSTHYCENRSMAMDFDKHDWESDDAEIAIYDKKGEWLTKEFEDHDDDVIGGVGINKWLRALDFCRKYKSK